MKKFLLTFFVAILISIFISSSCFAYYCFYCGTELGNQCRYQASGPVQSWDCSYGGTTHYAEKQYYWHNLYCPDCDTVIVSSFDDHVQYTEHRHNNCPYSEHISWCHVTCDY